MKPLGQIAFNTINKMTKGKNLLLQSRLHTLSKDSHFQEFTLHVEEKSSTINAVFVSGFIILNISSKCIFISTNQSSQINLII